MPHHGPLLNFSRRTFWYLNHENRLRNGESRKQCRNFIRKRGFWQGTVFGGDSFWGKMREKSQNPDMVFFLNRFSCLRYQNVRLGKLSRGHGSAYFAIGLHSSLFSPFSPFFLLSGDSFWGKMGKKSQNGGKVEKKTTLQADSKKCPNLTYT